MTDDANGLASYMRALSDLHSSQVHTVRSQLGNLSLHAALASETLRRAEGLETQVRGRLEQSLGKIEVDARVLLETVERWMGQTRLAAETVDFDLADVFAEIEALMRAYLMERRLQWALHAPAAPLPVRGDRGAVRRLLLTSMVERASALTAGDRLEARCLEDGVVTTVRLEAHRPDRTPDPVDVHLPVVRR